ncbi:hypothetical protein EA860_16410 [Vibrio anguillarum]|nr:hypothetical protein [Vibrio anguillarum]
MRSAPDCPQKRESTLVAVLSIRSSIWWSNRFVIFHYHMQGLTPNESERLYWENSKTVANFS